jgi:enamine deaminase RidA (YjgF/YER057c/UK114 family)
MPIKENVGAESKLKELGVTLPSPFTPVGNYVAAVRTGNLVFLSGMGPLSLDGHLITGRVGAALLPREAYDAARLVALGLLANLRAEIGSLDDVVRIVKVLGMVNCAPGFVDLPAVVDGCSDFLMELFGPDIGRHARSAVGMSELPYDIPVEIEMVVEVKS